MANMPVELNDSPALGGTTPSLRSSAARLLVPREHGSWGLWLLPLISGAVIAWGARGTDSVTAIAWFFVAAASAFLVHQPFQAWLGRSPLKARSPKAKRIALAATLILLSVSVASLIALALHGRSLILLLVAVAGACFFTSVLMSGTGTKTRSLRAPAQIVGALGLTSTAAGAYYAVSAGIDAQGALLWLASWLFAAAQIAYVQLRLRAASARSRREKFRAGWKVYASHLALLMIAASTALLDKVSWLLALAFVPAAARLALWALSPPARIRVHWLGFSELVHNVIFAVLLVAALRLG
jgi:hypothetical protein